MDLKNHALKLMELSRKFLAEDGDLDPSAFIITADDQLLRPIELAEEADKIESCRKIVEEAHQQGGLAIITVFLARSADFAGREFAEEGYSWGDIQEGSSDRCILVTVSGPGVKNWAAALPFKSAEGKIAFGKIAQFSEGVDLGLFPGWSEQITDPTAS